MTKNSFEKLKSKWDKKLADSGFKDIENKDGSLKKEVDPRTQAYAFKEQESREIYYDMAKTHLFSHMFETTLEENVWMWHVDGKSFRDIANTFNVTFYKVRQIVNTHQKLAGLKK